MNHSSKPGISPTPYNNKIQPRNRPHPPPRRSHRVLPIYHRRDLLPQISNPKPNTNDSPHEEKCTINKEIAITLDLGNAENDSSDNRETGDDDGEAEEVVPAAFVGKGVADFDTGNGRNGKTEDDLKGAGEEFEDVANAAERGFAFKNSGRGHCGERVWVAEPISIVTSIS
jgi:hypothetical protein